MSSSFTTCLASKQEHQILRRAGCQLPYCKSAPRHFGDKIPAISCLFIRFNRAFWSLLGRKCQMCLGNASISSSPPMDTHSILLVFMFVSFIAVTYLLAASTTYAVPVICDYPFRSCSTNFSTPKHWSVEENWMISASIEVLMRPRSRATFYDLIIYAHRCTINLSPHLILWRCTSNKSFFLALDKPLLFSQRDLHLLHHLACSASLVHLHHQICPKWVPSVHLTGLGSHASWKHRCPAVVSRIDMAACIGWCSTGYKTLV